MIMETGRCDSILHRPANARHTMRSDCLAMDSDCLTMDSDCLTMGSDRLTIVSALSNQ